MIAVGDITVFRFDRRRMGVRHHYLFVPRPLLWTFALVVPLGSVLLAASSFDGPKGEAQITDASSARIALPAPVVARSPDPVSVQLRRPSRVIDTSGRTHNLALLIEDALIALGYQRGAGADLKIILAWSLAEGQTDEQIDRLVNSAWSRGDFAAPKGLITPQGRFDTQKLLNAVLEQSVL